MKTKLGSPLHRLRVSTSDNGLSLEGKQLESKFEQISIFATNDRVSLFPSLVGELRLAHLTGEAVRVPRGRHGPDDAAHDELAALAAARRVQHVEVVLAVLPPLELVEHAVGKGTEALGAAGGDRNPFIAFLSCEAYENHQFLGTPVGIIGSYLEFDISFYVPLYCHIWNLTSVSRYPL